jgi:hypothetical protein
MVMIVCITVSLSYNIIIYCVKSAVYFSITFCFGLFFIRKNQLK